MMLIMYTVFIHILHVLLDNYCSLFLNSFSSISSASPEECFFEIWPISPQNVHPQVQQIKKTRFKYYSSMLCLIINRPSHHTMNIYMQSVPGSHPYARGREVCVFIALNAQISSQTPFRLQPWKTLTKALQAFYLVLHNVTYSTPI